MEKELILKAAADWVWIPPDAEDHVEAEYRLTVYPDRTSVQWSATERPVGELIAEVRERAQGTNPALRWWVSARTAPADTAATLLENGFELVETVEVLGLKLPSAEELTAALNPPGTVEARPANTPDLIYLAGQIDSQVFDWKPPTPAQLEQEYDALAKARGSLTTGRYLAYIHNRAVGSAGYTIADDIVRLWGGGVLPQARGRGAYRALLLARCLQGLRQGATHALVKGRIATSAPILRRAGFTPYDVEQCYQASLA